MKTLRTIAEVIGWFVIILSIAGSLGVGDFRLTYGPVKEDRQQ